MSDCCVPSRHLRRALLGYALRSLHMPEVPEDPAADLALVRAALAGDEQAKGRLLRRCESMVPRVIRVMNLRLGRRLDEHAVADLVQECLLTIWSSLGRYRGHGVLEAWAHGICEHLMTNALRRHGRSRQLDDQAQESTVDEAAAKAWRLMLAREEIENLLEQIGGLEADAVRMRHLGGLSFAEIAALQGIGLSAAKARYGRAMRRLGELRDRRSQAGEEENSHESG